MTSGNNCKTPPIWTDDKSFDNWASEIDLWLVVTDLKKEKRAPSIVLSLQGRKRDVAREIPLAELNHVDGVQALLAKLKEYFAKSSIDSSFEAYVNFQELTRKSGQPMMEYLLAYESAYQRIEKLEMKLPESVQACKLLYGASLQLTERQMVLAATKDLDVQSMKGTLKRVFCDTLTQTSQDARELKQEPVFKVTQVDSDTDNTAGEEQSAFYGGSGPKKFKFAYQRGRRGSSGRGNRGKPTTTGRNPKDSQGAVTTCRFCGSRNHWVRDCKDKAANDDEKGDVMLTFASISPSLLMESRGLAIIDTACTITVCGTNWMNDFVGALTDKQKALVQKNATSSRVMFGGGTVSHSISRCTIPIQLGDFCCCLDVEVIPGNLPLLFSLKSLKKGNAVIDTARSILTFASGSEVTLKEISSGHLVADVRPVSDAFCSTILMASDCLTYDSVLKLHRQFGHCNPGRLLKLLKNAGKFDEFTGRLIEDVCKNCRVCERFGKASPKPIVALPLSADFNDTIAIDLHEISHSPPKWYVHIIDLHTRFSEASLIFSKTAETIVDAVNKQWILKFGAPKRVLTDNGGEFDNEMFRQNAGFYGFQVSATAANSPFSNGCCERHNAVLTETFEKVCADLGHEDEKLCLQNAVFAKNCLFSHLGYSPYQLVYGRSPRLPNVIESELPALEELTQLEYFAKHLNALHSARRAFTAAESSERVKRALRFNVRNYERSYSSGEEVFYMKEGRWTGPATVIGSDSSVVFVRHSGRMLKVHASKLKLRKPDEKVRQASTSEETIENSVESACDPIPDEGKPLRQESLDCDCVPRPENQIEALADVPDTTISNESGEQAIHDSIDVHMQRTGLKKGQKVSILQPSGVFRGAEIIGRAGKKGGKNENWYNVQYFDADASQSSVELHPTDVNWNCDDTESTEGFIMLVEDAEGLGFHEAKLREIDNWKNFDVFDVVRSQGQQFVTSRWVCSVKPTGEHKARLVARGFQDPDLESLVRDSPTCSKDAFRVVMSIAASRELWKCTALDVKSAFLQSFPLKRDVFLKPPKGFESPDNLWKLKKCVYGLVDASRQWHDRVKFELCSLGLTQSAEDPCIFYQMTSESEGIITTHVDDFWMCGNHSFFEAVVDKISHIFDVGKLEDLPHKYLGLNLNTTDTGGLKLDLDHYKAKIAEMEGFGRNKNSDLLNSQQVKELRTLIGKLMWPAMHVKPEICFTLSYLASQLPYPTVELIKIANKAVRHVLNGPPIVLSFQALKNWSNISIICFTDASFNNNVDGSTHGGHLIFAMETDTLKCCLISWKSGKIRRIARSTLAAETFAMIDGINAAVFVEI